MLPVNQMREVTRVATDEEDYESYDKLGDNIMQVSRLHTLRVRSLAPLLMHLLNEQLSNCHALASGKTRPYKRKGWLLIYAASWIGRRYN